MADFPSSAATPRLSADARQRFERLLDAALVRQKAALDTAVTKALDQVPFLFRGVVKKTLGVK